MRVKNIVSGLLIFSALAISSDTFAQGQPRKTPEERAQFQTQWMQKNLNLTEDQNKKVYDIMLNRAREADKNRTNPSGPEKRAEKQTIKNETDAELKGVLTPDQYSKFQEHRQEMKERMKERKGAGNPGGY